MGGKEEVANIANLGKVETVINRCLVFSPFT